MTLEEFHKLRIGDRITNGNKVYEFSGLQGEFHYHFKEIGWNSSVSLPRAHIRDHREYLKQYRKVE